MKRLMCALVIFVMLCTSVFGMFSVNATTTISNDLLLHWDFVGNDLATQLSNKATAGSATDSISFATDGTSSKI